MGAMATAFYQMLVKRERTWHDYFQLSMSLFMFLNVMTKPKTLKGVFESEQMKYLDAVKNSLKVIN